MGTRHGQVSSHDIELRGQRRSACRGHAAARDELAAQQALQHAGRLPASALDLATHVPPPAAAVEEPAILTWEQAQAKLDGEREPQHQDDGGLQPEATLDESTRPVV